MLELHSLEQVFTQQGQVLGKIAFFNRPMEAELVDTFAAYGRAVDQRVQGPAEAGWAGAVAVIVRSVTTKADNMPHVGTLRYRDQGPWPPAVAVGAQDAERLSEWVRAHGQVEIELRLSCRDLGRTLSYNVIGDLRGRDRPEEVVLVGGTLTAGTRDRAATTMLPGASKPWRCCSCSSGWEFSLGAR